MKKILGVVMILFILIGIVIINGPTKEKNMKKYLSFYYDMSRKESSQLLKDEERLSSRWKDVIFGRLDQIVSQKVYHALIENR